MPTGYRKGQALSFPHWTSNENPRLSDVSFTVRAGEILGVYGLIGSGIETLADGLGGLHPRGLQGQITINGQRREVFKTPVAAKQARCSVRPS